VASPYGVIDKIIQDGTNGFLAASTTEWVSKLRMLLDEAELRARFASACRATVRSDYSLRTTAPRLATLLRDASAGSEPAHRPAEPVTLHD
jgi:glycosyltransferase involved in cell wall biosynthesis